MMTNTGKQFKSTHAMQFTSADEILLAHALASQGATEQANVILARHGFRLASK